MTMFLLVKKPIFWVSFLGYVGVSYTLIYLIGNPSLVTTYSTNNDGSGMSGGPGLPICLACLAVQLAGLSTAVAVRRTRSVVAAGLFAGIIAVILLMIVVLVHIYTSPS